MLAFEMFLISSLRARTRGEERARCSGADAPVGVAETADTWNSTRLSTRLDLGRSGCFRCRLFWLLVLLGDIIFGACFDFDGVDNLNLVGSGCSSNIGLERGFVVLCLAGVVAGRSVLARRTSRIAKLRLEPERQRRRLSTKDARHAVRRTFSERLPGQVRGSDFVRRRTPWPPSSRSPRATGPFPS